LFREAEAADETQIKRIFDSTDDIASRTLRNKIILHADEKIKNINFL